MNVRKAACSVIVVLALTIALAGCYSPLPTATFEITDWTQTYFTYLGYYGYVYVYYKVTNTGAVDIDYYQVWIEVTCADGSKFQQWANGLNVARGTYLTGYTLIDTAKKQASSVAITNYELTSY